MSEGKLWKDMHKNIDHLGHFSRVESHETSSGIPDVDFCIKGVEGHVELKFGNNRAPRIRSTQTRWFRHRVKEGGHPWMFTHIVIKKKDFYMLHGAAEMIDLTTERDTDVWLTTAAFVWLGSMDWHALVKCLSIRGKT